MSDQDIALLRDVTYPRNGKRWLSERWVPCDLHFTESRLFASPTALTFEEDKFWVNRKSFSYADINQAKLETRRGYYLLRLSYWTGRHHWWNSNWTDFSLTQQQFEDTRSLLGTIQSFNWKGKDWQLTRTYGSRKRAVDSKKYFDA